MYKKFTANKDSFVDKKLGENNYGKDELLEVGRILSGSSVYPKRALISFDFSAISASFASGEIDSASAFELRVFSNQGGTMLQDGFWIDTYVISSSWYEGTGSINYDNESGSVSWISSSTAAWNAAGGDYLSSPTASQYFATASGDLSLDVTAMVSQSINSEYDNYGFLIRLRDESTITGQDSKYFYSIDSDTIYDPVIYAKWNDVSTTGSVTESSSNIPYNITLKNKQETYSVEEEKYFELFTRLKNPTLTFDNEIGTLSSIPLTNLSYSIYDVQSGEYVIPFDAYTSCSYDSTKNYFSVDMSVLEENRTYELKLMHESGSLRRFYPIQTFRTTR